MLNTENKSIKQLSADNKIMAGFSTIEFTGHDPCTKCSLHNGVSINVHYYDKRINRVFKELSYNSRWIR